MKKLIILFVSCLIALNISAQCPVPTNITVSNITLTSAQISWDYDAPVTSFTIEYGYFILIDWVVVNTSSTSITLTQLLPSSTYSVYIKANCSSGESSDYTEEFIFQTSCNPIPLSSFDPVNYWSYPMAECWVSKAGILPESGNAILSYTNWGWETFVQSPDNNVGVYLYDTCAYWLLSPSIDLGNSDTLYQLQFDFRKYFYGTNLYGHSDQSPNTRLAVLISTDNGLTWNSNRILQEWNNSTGLPFNTFSNSFQTYFIPIFDSINMVPYSGVVKFAFYAYENDSTSYCENVFQLDNFNIVPFNGCNRPSNLVSSNHNLNGITLSWTENGSATQWQIKYGLTGFSPTNTGSTITTNSNSYTFTNLNPETTYDFYVRSVCNTNVYSSWSTKHTASTTCPIMTIPFFEQANQPFMPPCWSQQPSLQIQFNAWNMHDLGSGQSHSYLLGFASNGNIGTSRLISPAINFDNVGEPILTFHQIIFDMHGVTTLKIQTSSDLINWVDQPFTYGPGNLVEIPTVNVPLTVSLGINYVSWVVEGDTSLFSWLIQNIMITDSYPCFPPNSIYVNPNYATVSWVPQGSENSWILEYKLASSSNWNVIPVDTNVYTFTGLQSLSNYEIRIKSVCDSSQSAYSNVIPFTTSLIEETAWSNFVEIFPNPTNSEVNINIQNDQIKILNSEIFDIYGKHIQDIQLNQGSNLFNISSYSSGVYFVKIFTDKGSLMKKIVKN